MRGMMGSRKIRFFLVLFLVFMVKGFAGRRGVEGLLLNSPPHLDDETVEKMWLNCGLDLLVIKEQVRSSSFSFPNDIFHDTNQVSPGTRLHSTSSIREAINLLSPEVNRSFLDCLSKQNFPLHLYGDDNLRNWFVDFLESLLSQPTTLRRPLAVQPSQSQAHASPLAPAPSPATSPQAQPPGPASAPSSLPSPVSEAEIFPDSSASSSSYFFPEGDGIIPDSVEGDGIIPDSVSVKVAKKKNASDTDSVKAKKAKKKDNSNKDNKIPDSVKAKKAKKKDDSDDTDNAIILAVILTAVGTSLFFLLILLCYLACRKSRKYSANSRKDDRPLLCLSEYSSSNKVEALSFNTDLSKKDCELTLGTNSVVASTSEVHKEQSEAAINASPSKPPPPPPVMPPPQAPLPPPPGAPRPPSAPRPPGAPPPPKSGPLPPAPPKAGGPPPPRKGPLTGKSPLGPKQSASKEDIAKTKLKPFFWDKVAAKPDQTMVWDQLKAGSFQFSEEAIENLFGCAQEKNKGDSKKESASKEPQFVRILDPKKAQNLAISLKALNAKSEEVCEALTEGNELPSEILQTLMKMAPTSEEELKLRLHNDLSQLGPAEQFLKVLIEIPFVFQRMEVLLLMASLPEEVKSTTESFSTIEIACQEMKNNRLFLKLLEAVLKTGNRMNDGTYRGGAQAFKLDTLLKLADVRGTDGKTTLLHFVIQEMIRYEGMRAARMSRESQTSFSSIISEDLTEDVPVDSGECFQSLGLKMVSGLSNELENVKKAANLDADALTSTAASLGERLLKTKEFLRTKMEDCEECQFLFSLRAFVEHTEAEITHLLEEERRIRLLVKNTTDYFHGNAGKDEGLRLFAVVRDFMLMVDKVCRQLSIMPKPPSKTSRAKETPAQDPSRDLPTMSPARDPRQLLFPAIQDRKIDSSSSDDD